MKKSIDITFYLYLVLPVLALLQLDGTIDLGAWWIIILLPMIPISAIYLFSLFVFTRAIRNVK